MNPTGNEPRTREEKIALLRKHPPKMRAAGVQAPSRLRNSGEIIIRSHDPDPKIGDYDEGDTTLPRGILNTGDIELLRIYKELYGDTLRTMPDGRLYVEYLDQRIAGLDRVRQQKEESRKKTERRELPPLPPVQESPDGTIMLTGVRQTEYQTATQGCWSVSLSNILRSRGVQLSQKDIRSFRPTISFDTGNARKAPETNEINNDGGSDPYHDSELVMDNIPNTAVRHWGFEDLPTAVIDERGNVYRDHTDDIAVKAIREQVEYALKHDQSPIALKYCGHYQTIVGIKGNKVFLKDSLPQGSYYDKQGGYHAPDPDATLEVDLYEIVQRTRSLPEPYNRDLSLMWLSELHRDPKTDKVEELKDYPDLRVDQNGKLTLTQAQNVDMLTVEGVADTECGKSAPVEKEGLIPFYKTKFPNVIHKDMLKDVREPSKTVAEHLTIPDAELSREARENRIVAKLPGYEEVIDPFIYMTGDDELNRAIQASLETAREEQLRIQENIRLSQANKAGSTAKPKTTTAAPKTPTVTAKPKVTTAQPKATTTTPKVNTATPKINTAEPKITTTEPKTDTSFSVFQDDQEEPRGMDKLSDTQLELIGDPKRLNELAEIFSTKKSYRIVNWNSGKYNDAKRALDEYMAEYKKISAYIKENYEKPGFDEGVEQHIASLNEKEEKLRTHLTAYVRKVTDGGKTAAGRKGVADMTQAAGAARLSGARGLLDLLGGEDNGAMNRLVGERNGVNYYIAEIEGNVEQQFTEQEMEIIRREAKLMENERPKQGYNRPDRLSAEQKVELLNRNYDRQKEERVRDISYETLYSQKYEQLKKDGEKNAHRRAAAYAQEELEKQPVKKQPSK